MTTPIESFALKPNHVLTVVGRLLFVMCPVVIGGCFGNATTISGAVTLDGAPIDSGTISFVPLAGGPSIGSSIKSGRYSVPEASPGEYRVDIVGFSSAPPLATSSAEMEAMSRSAPTGDGTPTEVTANAKGNGVEITLAAGSQNHDFALTSSN